MKGLALPLALPNHTRGAEPGTARARRGVLHAACFARRLPLSLFASQRDMALEAIARRFVCMLEKNEANG